MFLNVGLKFLDNPPQTPIRPKVLHNAPVLLRPLQRMADPSNVEMSFKEDEYLISLIRNSS